MANEKSPPPSPPSEGKGFVVSSAERLGWGAKGNNGFLISELLGSIYDQEYDRLWPGRMAGE